MGTLLLPALIDHCLTRFATVQAIADGTAMLVDGPLGRWADDGRPAVLVGARLDDDDTDGAGGGALVLARMGGARPGMDDAPWLVCTAAAMVGGDTDLSAARQMAVDLADGCAESLRGTPANWSASGRVTYLHVTDYTYRTTQSRAGARVEIAFTVSAKGPS